MHSLRGLDPFFTEIRGRVKFIQGHEILTQQTGHADVSYEVQNIHLCMYIVHSLSTWYLLTFIKY